MTNKRNLIESLKSKAGQTISKLSDSDDLDTLTEYLVYCFKRSHADDIVSLPRDELEVLFDKYLEQRITIITFLIVAMDTPYCEEDYCDA